MAKRIKIPARTDKFFELLGTYIGIGLWGPARLNNQDLTWIGIPIVADNPGNDFILRKHYTATRPTSWMLQELAFRSLATNTTIVSKRLKGESWKWSIKAGGRSRNVSPQINGSTQRAPDWGDQKFGIDNIREMSAMELLGGAFA